MLELQNLSKSFVKDHTALKVLVDVSLTLTEGEFVAVQGPSGCGKTTLLLSAGGLLRPDKGRVLIEEQDIYSLHPDERAIFRAKHLGFVFQQYHLIPYLTVFENVLAPAIASGGSDLSERTGHLLEHFGLDQRRHHLPGELSAGEKQRVALARALLLEPGILLADEVTGNLDDKNADVILEHLRTFARDGGAVLLVTHNCRITRKTDRTITMNIDQNK